ATTADDYTLTLTVSQGTLSVLTGTLTDTDADANELVVTGGIESLNAFLGSGALGYAGTGGTLTTVLSRGSQSVRGSINLVGTAELLPPVSLLPGAIGVVPDAASPIVFGADALGSDASRLRVTLSVSGDGSFSAASIGTPGTDANAVVVSGSGTTSTSFTGSASALSAYFANASRIAYTGVATQTMTVLVERLSNDSPFATLASNRASVQLYGASRLGESAPVITGLPTTLWITANTSSNLRFTGAAIANTPTTEVLTLTLSLPAGNDVLALGTQPGLAATAGGGVTVNAASTARTLILRGTAANLQSFLASDGAIRYTGPATAAASAPLMLGVRLDNAVAASTVQALLAAPTQPATANAGGAMRLPAGVVATPGALATPAFAANAVTGTGLLTMRFAASSAATLVWQSDTALRTAAGGALLAAGSGSALTLVGSAAELSAWLAAARLTLLATGTGSVSVALESTPAANSAPVISNGVITVDYSPAQSTVAGAAALQLRLPLAATVQAGASSTITIAGSTAARVGPATDTALTLGLRVATGTLSATNFAGLASGALSENSRSLLLTGTAAQINSWLAAGRLSYTGAGEALEVVLGETGASAAQSLNGAVQLIAASPVVPTLSVPQSVPVLANTASNLVLVGSPVAGSGTLTLTASVATGTLAAASDGALTDIDAAANMVRVSGTAAQINAWLEAGKLRYSGAGEALQLSVTNESGAARSTTARVALSAVVPVETAGPAGLAMALPRTIPVTSGANVALLMPGTPLGGAAGTVYTLTLAATAGTLTASPSRTGDASALAALADLDSAAGVVRMQGSVATLNAWLSSGRLIYNGPAAVLNATLSLGDQSVSSAIDLSAGAASSSPTLVAPGVLPVVPNVASPIAFAANALGVTSALRTVTLKVADGGVFTAVSAADSGVTVSGSGSATITLTGTAAAISAYLAASPASISYTGIATRVDANGMRAQTLFMAVDGSGNRSEAEIALYGASNASAIPPSITALSSRLWVTPAVSSHLKFDAATLGGTGALTLALSLPAQSQLALGAGEGLMASLAQGETGVSVSASSTARTLVVSGTAAQLSALLAGTTSQIRYTGPGATATGTPIALQLQLVDSIGHASSTAVSLEAPTVSTATLSGATLTLPVSRVATPGARVPLMLGSEAFRAAGLAPISVEIEAPQAAVTVIGAVAGVVTLASGTVTVSVGDTFTREVDGTSVSIASTRLTGSAAALNELFSRADGVMVESAAGGSIAIRVVGDISSRGQVAVTASPAPDKVMSGPSLRVPAGYTLPSGGTILLPTQAVAGEGVLKLVVSTSAGALKWAASSALRAATTGEATLTAGTGATLTLVGSAQTLNAFLTTRGALRFEGDADAVLSFALSTQPTDDKPALIARAESAITVLAVDLERTPTLGLRLPQGLALAATGSTSFVIEHDLVVADRAGAVTLTLTLPSAVTGGEAATLALLASPDGVTITRQPNGQIALSGTAAALNAYLKTANALSYTGPAGMLGFAVAQGDLRAEGSTLLKRATPGNTQLRNAPRLALPFNLVPAATSGALVLDATAIQPARWSNLAGTMAVEFSLTAGALKLGALPAGITAADADGVALVAGDSAGMLRLSGPAGALTAWLASVPAVGAAAPLTYVSDPDAGDLGLPAGAITDSWASAPAGRPKSPASGSLT
ncbi:MAG: beta strand repeat-containing protein, partial [Betaproteobacteria bacterium]